MRLALIATATLLTACSPSQLAQRHADGATERITYTRDTRTGLCFAVYLHNQDLALTHVPCEPVERLLVPLR
jgi:hypothetical protein